MKKLLTLFLILTCLSLQALTILDEKTGKVSSTGPSYDHNPNQYKNNFFTSQPEKSNSLYSRYMRKEISTKEYLDSLNLPNYEYYDVTPTGRNSYNIKRIY